MNTTNRHPFFAVALTALLASAAACDSDKDAAPKNEAAKAGGADSLEGLDPGTAFAIESGRENLEEVRAGIKKGDPDSVKFSCAAASGYAEGLAKSKEEVAKKFAAEVGQVCGHDLPMAMIEVGLKQIEAEKKAKPDSVALGPCVNVGLALDELKESQPKAPELKDLSAKIDAACG